jgi:hypothetical protein
MHSMLDRFEDFLTDAEQVVLLHRDSKQPPTAVLAEQRTAVKPAA